MRTRTSSLRHPFLPSFVAATTAAFALLSTPSVQADEERDPDAEEASTDAEPAPKRHASSDEQDETAPAPARKSRWLQLSASTTLVSYTKLSFTLQRPSGPEQGSITELGFGPSANPVTFEFGYLVSESLSLGLLLELGNTQMTTRTGGFQNDLALGRFLVGPRAEYSFGDTVKPYILGIVGFTTVPQEGELYTVSLTGIEFLLGVGLHIFLADSFSVDPSIRGVWGTGYGSVKDPLGNVDATGKLLGGAALLGLSGWI